MVVPLRLLLNKLLLNALALVSVNAALVALARNARRTANVRHASAVELRNALALVNVNAALAALARSARRTANANHATAVVPQKLAKDRK